MFLGRVKKVSNTDGYVFRDFIEGHSQGPLQFVGDFDGLYKNNPDPWEQAANGPSDMQVYYDYSRARLISTVRKYAKGEAICGLEIGCGHGHVVNLLNADRRQYWAGADISPTAIAQAKQNYPKWAFYERDITEIRVKHIYPKGCCNMVVLGQILWYTLPKMDNVVRNCFDLLNKDGLLIISQGFLREPQRYGVDIADGFSGTVKLFVEQYWPWFNLIEAQYDDSGRYVHNDGLLVFRRAFTK